MVKSTDVTFKYDLNNLKCLLHLKLSVICFLKEIIDKELINSNILTILFNYKKKTIYIIRAIYLTHKKKKKHMFKDLAT